MPMFFLNPIFGMLRNTKTGRFHPIFFYEHPLPGGGEPGVIRLKSKGHHTTGFEDRTDAIKDAEEKAPADIPGARFDWSRDLEWSGEEIPAMVMLLAETPNGPRLV